jgi:hypothetical protein
MSLVEEVCIVLNERYSFRRVIYTYMHVQHLYHNSPAKIYCLLWLCLYFILFYFDFRWKISFVSVLHLLSSCMYILSRIAREVSA